MTLGYIIQIAVAAAACAALLISLRSQRGISRIVIPAAICRWVRSQSTGLEVPLERDFDEFKVWLSDRDDDFLIGEIRLTRWDEYWAKYRLHSGVSGQGQTDVLIEVMDGKSPLPGRLRVKVELREGRQSAHWQQVRIQNLPPLKSVWDKGL